MAANFDSRWHLSYWFPSNDHEGEDVSEYDMEYHGTGKAIIFESVPMADGSHIFARLVGGEGGVYTGTWYEDTAPKGPFGGSQYSGAGQLKMSEDGAKLEGIWAGAGYDHDTKETKIYSGRWLIERLDAEK